MSEFAIERTELGAGMMEISVAGFLDAHTFEQLEESIQEAFGEGMFKVIVDLEHVEYISSAGAGVFIGALSESQENGGNIVLVGPSDGVMQVFDLLGLTQIFRIAASRGQAAKMF